MRAWRGGTDALTTSRRRCFRRSISALPIGAMIAIREQGREPLFLLMLTVIVSDTAQYYTGRLLGRHLLAPAISPKKTIEGAIGGFVFGTLRLAALGAWWLPSCRSAARIAARHRHRRLGIAGDLFESMLKRSAGVKDSSASFRATAASSIGSTRCSSRRRSSTWRHFSGPRRSEFGQHMSRLRPSHGSYETHRHSRIHRLDRPERARGGRCAPGSAAGRRAGGGRERRAAGGTGRALSAARRGDGVGGGASIGCGGSAGGASIAGTGRDGLVAVASHPDVDLVLCASSGTDGLEAVLAAIEHGKTIALANKEVLVMAGGLVTDAARRQRRRHPAGGQRAQRRFTSACTAASASRSAG